MPEDLEVLWLQPARLPDRRSGLEEASALQDGGIVGWAALRHPACCPDRPREVPRFLERGKLTCDSTYKFFLKSLLGDVLKEVFPLLSVRLMSAEAIVHSVTVAAADTAALFFFAIRKTINHFHRCAPYNCLLLRSRFSVDVLVKSSPGRKEQLTGF